MDRSKQETLELNGVDKIIYYNGNSPLVDTIFTACLFINTTKKRIEARGVSICSLRDTFCRKEGKNKAYGRAMKAIIRKNNDYKINSQGRENEIIVRSIKVKNDQDEKDRVIPFVDKLVKFDPELQVDVLAGNGKYQKEYRFSLPANYPINLAHNCFRFKSQYRPKPTGSIEHKFLEPPEIKKASKKIRSVKKAA